MHAVAVAVPLLVALSVAVTAGFATFAIRIALFGRPRARKIRGVRAFLRARWQWLRRDEPRRRSRELATVIPLDAARRARAAPSSKAPPADARPEAGGGPASTVRAD